MTDNRYFSRNYFLTPGECNAQSEMPLWLLVEQIIEVGTLHANSWGVGYARLIEQNRGWVLSRLAVEMKRYPSVNEHYTLTTWVESYNRRFSERLVEITDENGEKQYSMAFPLTKDGTYDVEIQVNHGSSLCIL